MQARSEELSAAHIKMLKTAALLGIINFFTVPAYQMTTSAWIFLAMGTNAFVLYQFAQMGERRRPGANLTTRAYSLFTSYLGQNNTVQTNELQNAYRNVINGGAVYADEIMKHLEEMQARSPSPR